MEPHPLGGLNRNSPRLRPQGSNDAAPCGSLRSGVFVRKVLTDPGAFFSLVSVSTGWSASGRELPSTSRELSTKAVSPDGCLTYEVVTNPL